MLEFEAASKRFGALAALDTCSFTAEPGGSPASSVRTAPARPRRCGLCSGSSSSTGCRALARRSHRARRAGAIRLHAGGAGAVTAHACP